MTRALLCLALVGCWGREEPPPVTPDEAEVPDRPALTLSEATPHVVVLTLDTLRADRIGAWGYPHAHTETIDALAASGRRFTQAYSPLPLTIPAHATLFSGQYPPTLGIRGNGQGVFGEDRTSLAEILQARGWRTGASVAAFVTTKVWGFSQGYDAYFDAIPTDAENYWHGERQGEKVVDDALAWVKEQPAGQPLHLWVHLYDAHFPYRPPESYLKLAGDKPYDGEIAYLDDQVERVVKAFEGQPTLFVIAADHGEGLGDHRELYHGLYAYNATQHIPLIFSGAGVQPAVVDAPASLADVLPMVLTQLKLPIPEGVEGVADPAQRTRPVYLETWQLTQRFGIAPHRAVIDGRWKLIATPRPELYDIVADPLELRDVSAEHPDEVKRLMVSLDAFGFDPPGEQAEMDPAVTAQLEQLGYVDGGAKVDLSGPLQDPKDHTKLVVLIQRAERQAALDKPAVAEQALRELITGYPKVVEFRTRLAALLGRQKRPEEARKVVEEAIVLDPTNPQLRMALASHLAEAGKLEEASRIFAELAAASPFQPRLRTLAVLSQLRSGDVAGAEERARAWLETYPDDPSLAGAFGVLLAESGRAQEAGPWLAKGAAATVPELDVCFLLAARAIGEGDLDGAIVLLERELKHYDRNYKAWATFTRLAAQKQRWADQLKGAEILVAANPADPEMANLRVLALFNLTRFPEARAALDKALARHPNDPSLMLMDANLLAKEGKMEKGKARFAEAQAAMEQQQAAKRAQQQAAQEANPLGIPMATDADYQKMPRIKP